MTDEILPMGYPPKTRRVCQPYIDQIAALSASLAVAEAALASAKADGYAEGLKDASDVSLARSRTAFMSAHSSAPIREDEASVITLKIRALSPAQEAKP
jgi:hypothetical protein